MKVLVSWGALAAFALGGCSTDSSNKKTDATPGSLISMGTEAPGANCANGGTSIQTGRDTNANGTLDASEVTGTQYVCAPGAGARSLLNVTVEAVGDNCAFGGSKIETGTDDNGDNTLNPNEVDDTQYVCNDGGPDTADPWEGIYLGNLTIRSVADLAQLEGIKVVLGYIYVPMSFDGDLTVTGLERVSEGLYFDNCSSQEGTLTSATFSDLAYISEIEIDGDCESYSLSLESLSFPALTSLGDLEIDYTSNLTTLDFPELVTLGGLDLEYTESLTSLLLPKVTSLDYLEIYEAYDLATLSFPALTQAGYISLEYLELTTISMPLLETVIEFDMEDVEGLTSLSLPSLTSVGEFSLEYMDDFVTLDLPVLAMAGEITLEHNEDLVSAEFPMLREVDGIELYDNEVLEGPMFASLDYVFDYGIVEDNDSLSQCVEIKVLNAVRAGQADEFYASSNGDECTEAEGLCPVFAPLNGIGTFRFCYSEATFDDAVDLCESIEGYELAYLNSTAEAQALMSLRYDADLDQEGPLAGDDFWVGLTDADEEGTWVWTSGTTSYTPDLDTQTEDEFWTGNEPYSDDEDADCAVVGDYSARAFAAYCDNSFFALCRLAE